MSPKNPSKTQPSKELFGADQYLEQSLPHTMPVYEKKRFITENQLGQLIVKYERVIINPGDRFLLIVSGILSISILVYASYQYLYSSINFGQSVGVAWSRPGFLLGGGLLVAWLCGLALTWLGRKSTAVRQQGLVFWKPGRPQKLFQWQEIAGVSFAQDEWIIISKKFIRYHAVLYPNQEKPIHLKEYCPKADLVELMTRLKAHLYPHLEPELRQDVTDGKRIYFGPISISLDGLYLDNHLHAWKQVKRLDIENGFLQISMQDDTLHRLIIRRIPNLELFIPLTRLASEIALRQGTAS